MIVTFKDKETEKIFHQEFSRKLPHDIRRIALRKLIIIDQANMMPDLLVPPSNHLEKLLGTNENIWSIRINDQWRIIFRPSSDWKNFYDVSIVDYH